MSPLKPKPAILIKKYAQPAGTARAYNPNDATTLGYDAESAATAANIPYLGSALYRILVQNTGNTWLKDISINDQLPQCGDLQVIDRDSSDDYLQPAERWVFECRIDDVQDDIRNTATVSAYAMNPDGTPTNQAPVNDLDVAHVQTHEGHSIGNFIWIDDGNGREADRNNGIADAGEIPAPDGVVLELNDASGQPVDMGSGPLTTVTAEGYYLFSGLPAGDYQVCVAAVNFESFGLLETYGISDGSGSEPVANDDGDQNNNGLAPADGKVCSSIVTLNDLEPGGRNTNRRRSAG